MPELKHMQILPRNKWDNPIYLWELMEAQEEEWFTLLIRRCRTAMFPEVPKCDSGPNVARFWIYAQGFC